MGTQLGALKASIIATAPLAFSIEPVLEGNRGHFDVYVAYQNHYPPGPQVIVKLTYICGNGLSMDVLSLAPRYVVVPPVQTSMLWVEPIFVEELVTLRTRVESIAMQRREMEARIGQQREQEAAMASEFQGYTQGGHGDPWGTGGYQ